MSVNQLMEISLLMGVYHLLLFRHFYAKRLPFFVVVMVLFFTYSHLISVLACLLALSTYLASVVCVFDAVGHFGRIKLVGKGN